ncbi:type I iodothyronine deiodinase-like [Ptychodera flava]|uniref:type I iodothyronine deiodinase-like n=1 Tax=Ptychodera flava TaxID=63121 RepID=UPI003969EE9D
MALFCLNSFDYFATNLTGYININIALFDHPHSSTTVASLDSCPEGLISLIQAPPAAVLDGGALSRVFHDYKDKAESLFVYIIEAHPTNGWSFGVNHFSFVKFPKSIEDRRDTARMMMSLDEDLFTTDINDVSKLCVVLDNMDEALNLSYRAQPDRVFIIVGDKIEYIGKTVLQQLVTPDRLFAEDIRECFDKNM